MSKCDEKVVLWCSQQFALFVANKHINALLRSKNGPIFEKLFQFMADRIKSKKNGERIRLYSELVNCEQQIVSAEKQMNGIQRDSSLLSSAIVEKHNKFNIIKASNSVFQYQTNYMKIIAKIVDKIANQNKTSTDFAIDSRILSEVLSCYESIFSAYQSNGLTCPSNGNNIKSPNITLQQINDLIDDINSTLLNINCIKIISDSDVSFDSQSVLSSVSEVKSNKITINGSESKKEMTSALFAKQEKIINLKIAVYNAIQEFNLKIRDKQNRLKEKLEKIIVMCDASIQEKR